MHCFPAINPLTFISGLLLGFHSSLFKSILSTVLHKYDVEETCLCASGYLSFGVRIIPASFYVFGVLNKKYSGFPFASAKTHYICDPFTPRCCGFSSISHSVKGLTAYSFLDKYFYLPLITVRFL